MGLIIVYDTLYFWAREGDVMSKTSIPATAKASGSPMLVTTIENAGKIGGALGAFGAIAGGLLHVNGMPLDVDLLLKTAAVGAAGGGAIGAIKHAGSEVLDDVKRWVNKKIDDNDFEAEFGKHPRIEPHMTIDRRPAYGVSYGTERVEPRVEWQPAVLEDRRKADRRAEDRTPVYEAPPVELDPRDWRRD